MPIQIDSSSFEVIFSADSSYQHSLGSRRSHKRRRRILVSESSNSDSECGIEDRPRSLRNNISVDKEIPTFTTQEVINLLKAIPSTSSQNQNHFSMISNAVPEFNPANKEQTINIWLTKVEECSKLYKWSETQLLHYTLPKLMGVAKFWYEGLPSVNFTWNEWKQKKKI